MIGNHIYTILNESPELMAALAHVPRPLEVPLPKEGVQAFPALSYTVSGIEETSSKTGDDLFMDVINVDFEIFSSDYKSLAQIAYILRKHLHKRQYQCAEFRISQTTFVGYSENWFENIRAYSAVITYGFNTKWRHI